MTWTKTTRGKEWKALNPRDGQVWTVKQTGVNRWEGIGPQGQTVCTQPTQALAKWDVERHLETAAQLGRQLQNLV